MPKLKLLPAQTIPADEVLVRRHDPRLVKKDYTVFRDCLRWEFGFSCAICLLHERDIVAYESEGWGITQIEHLVPRSLDDDLVGSYGNLIYICRLCNVARSDTPQIDDEGRRLLDPTRDVWADHFVLKDDELAPLDGDVDAAHTEDVYNINDARKVKLRRIRRERTNDIASLIRSAEMDLSWHHRSTGRLGAASTPGSAEAVLRCRERLEILYRRRRSDLAEWVPSDAPKDCRCGRANARSLPPPYLRQVVEVDAP